MPALPLLTALLAVSYPLARSWAHEPPAAAPGWKAAGPSLPIGDQPSFWDKPWIFEPGLDPAPARTSGRELGWFRMSEQLDRHRDLIVRQLGARNWSTSLATDAQFKQFYLLLTQRDGLLLHPVRDFNELRGEGVVVPLDPATSYRFKVSVYIFDPVRGSTLHIKPANGSRGPSHQLSTGEVLDLLRSKSFVFNVSGNEYWLLYATDVDPQTGRFAQTRTLVFFHENGINSKAWHLGDDSLKPGVPMRMQLGDVPITLLRTPDGMLRLHESVPAAVDR